jgi:hypothetical protein
MNEVLNGQIVPALGQSQAIILIIVCLAVASLLRLVWRLGRSS